jgi:hypothetical protein
MRHIVICSQSGSAIFFSIISQKGKTFGGGGGELLKIKYVLIFSATFNWIGHILRRNCLLKQVIEGKIKGEIEVTGRRGRRRKKLLDDLKERRGYSHLKEEALDRTIWRNRFGRGVGHVVRQNTE